MAKKVRKIRQDKPVNVTIYVTRKGYTQPEKEDIFSMDIPEYLYNKFKEMGDIVEILEYIQDDPDMPLSDKLMDKDYISDISSIRLDVCVYDEPLSDGGINRLIDNIRENLISELDLNIEQFLEHFDIPKDQSLQLLLDYIDFLKKRRGLQL